MELFHYLYGKYDNLKGLIHNGDAIRFTDIHYYAELENEKMRDNESIRECALPKDQIGEFSIAGHNIPISDIVGDIQFSLPTRRCHCLCLSKTGFSNILFERFEADVCIKIRTSFLLALLQPILSSYHIEIIGKDIEYFTNFLDVKSKEDTQLVFHKNTYFSDEDEFRIAIFYPHDEKSIFVNGAVKTPIFSKDQRYIEISYPHFPHMQAIVAEARNNEGKTIFMNPNIFEIEDENVVYHSEVE